RWNINGNTIPIRPLHIDLSAHGQKFLNLSFRAASLAAISSSDGFGEGRGCFFGEDCLPGAAFGFRKLPDAFGGLTVALFCDFSTSCFMQKAMRLRPTSTSVTRTVTCCCTFTT